MRGSFRPFSNRDRLAGHGQICEGHTRPQLARPNKTWTVNIIQIFYCPVIIQVLLVISRGHGAAGDGEEDAKADDRKQAHQELLGVHIERSDQKKRPSAAVTQKTGKSIHTPYFINLDILLKLVINRTFTLSHLNIYYPIALKRNI